MADPNRALFETVVHLLSPVLDELVFVGGCTTGLFITDPAASGVRATRDVDGRPEIVNDVLAADADLRDFIGMEIRALLDHRDFTEALSGFLLPDRASQARRGLLEGRLRQLSTT